MNNKLIKIIFLLLISAFLGLGANFIFAQTPAPDLEVTYPAVGTGVEPPTQIQTYLPRYIRYIYHFSIIAGGLIAFLAVIYGGFRFLTSTGNPAATQDAREQIFAGLLGLVIILGSFIILNEINPDLISLRPPVPGEPLGKGIIVYANTAGAGGNCGGLGVNAGFPGLVEMPPGVKYKSLPESGQATLGEDEDGNLVHPESFFALESSEELRIEYYGDRDCEADPIGTEDQEFDKGDCVPIDPDNVRCIKFVRLTPGVWVFNKLDNGDVPDPLDLPLGWSEGKDYVIFQTSQDSLLKSEFHDRVEAIALVSSKPELGINYGVVLHNMPKRLSEEHQRGWAQIYLPGSSSFSDGGHPVTCEYEDDPNTKQGITRCGPFDNSYGCALCGDMGDTSSLTIFAVPNDNTITAGHEITICRNDNCDPERVGDDFFDASITYVPANDFENLTNTFSSGNPVNTGDNIIFGINLVDPSDPEEWQLNGGEPIDYIRAGHSRAEAGVSYLGVQEGAHYIVLLFEEPFDDWQDINTTEQRVEVATTRRSIPSLKTNDWDDMTAAIIVIKTLAGAEH